jgi:hypothetical protein
MKYANGETHLHITRSFYEVFKIGKDGDNPTCKCEDKFGSLWNFSMQYRSSNLKQKQKIFSAERFGEIL